MNRTAAELAEYLGAKLHGDARLAVSGVAGPGNASPSDLIYLDAPKFTARVEASAAKCVLAPPGAQLTNKTVLEIADPKFAFAKAAAWLAPQAASKSSIHPTAIIAPSAKVAANVTIGPYAVIEEDVAIGAASVIGAFAFIGRGSRIGANCILHPRVTLYAAVRLDDRVEIHSGAVIGSDGFGYVLGEGRYWKFPQIGKVEIAADVEIGANTTIDRGSLETTAIATGVKIDNLVQIAHNVRIGEHSVIAAQTGISGSSTVGKRAMIGGQVGIADHCTIEDGAIVGAQAGIPTGKTIRGEQIVWGTPARPLEKFKSQYAWFARLPELAERVRKLEATLRERERNE
ncbi:MAG: UDP-3-O-(3-hydroxymyristoyl)glucosamine N-acyltransferase [Candidatus Acidiferrales bacterium]